MGTDTIIRNLLIFIAFLAYGCTPDNPPPAAPQHELSLVAAAGSQVPRLAPGPGDSLLMSWLEPDGNGMALRCATLAGEAWSDARTVARGDDWFVNWADLPSVIAIDESLWAAHWPQKAAAGTYEYDVMVSLSRNGGEGLVDLRRVSADGSAGPVTTVATTASGRMSGFPQIAGLGEHVVVVWTDASGDSTQVRARFLDAGELAANE